MNTFGDRLRSQRERLGLSRKAFGKRCGVSAITQFLYEKNWRDPIYGYLHRTAELGISLDYLTTGRGPRDFRYPGLIPYETSNGKDFAQGFAQRLMSERKRLGITEHDFGTLCGVKVISQYFYEKGDREPGLPYLERVAMLGISLDYLFAGAETNTDALE